jgi:thiol-disulfide isomerase/thioredoxin
MLRTLTPTLRRLHTSGATLMGKVTRVVAKDAASYDAAIAAHAGKVGLAGGAAHRVGRRFDRSLRPKPTPFSRTPRLPPPQGSVLLALFTGSADAAGHSWCPDCNDAHPVIEAALAQAEADVTLVEVRWRWIGRLGLLY